MLVSDLYTAVCAAVPLPPGSELHSGDDVERDRLAVVLATCEALGVFYHEGHTTNAPVDQEAPDRGAATRALGVDFGLNTVVKAGDRVKHCNAGWGLVLEVVPQSDGTAELRVERLRLNEREFLGKPRESNEGWWGTYHCVDHDPGAQRELPAGYIGAKR